MAEQDGERIKVVRNWAQASDGIQHSRTNIWIVSQSVFFALVGTASKQDPRFMCIAGVVGALLCVMWFVTAQNLRKWVAGISR